jgi:transcriptional regulator with XRE-family HTH domain
MDSELTRIIDKLQAARGQWHVVAEQLGIPRITLARIARGQTDNPTLSTLEKLRPVLKMRFGQTKRAAP